MQIGAQKIAPCLWFDTEAVEAANFYVSVFKNSKIILSVQELQDHQGRALSERRPGDPRQGGPAQSWPSNSSLPGRNSLR